MGALRTITQFLQDHALAARHGLDESGSGVVQYAPCESGTLGHGQGERLMT